MMYILNFMNTTYRLRIFVFLLVFLSIQYCVYPVAIDTRVPKHGRSKAVDFIDDLQESSVFYEEQQRSRPIYEDAVNYCKKMYNCSQQDLALLSPRYSSCAWLQVTHMDHSGLGHTFATWAYYMQLAWDNHLTFYSPFYTASRDTRAYLNASAYFLGMHSVYYWGRSPSSNRIYVKIGDERGDCSHDMISDVVRKYKSSTGFDCSKGMCVLVLAYARICDTFYLCISLNHRMMFLMYVIFICT